MDGNTELKYALIVFLIFLCLFLGFKVYLSSDRNDEQEEPVAISAQHQLITQIDSNQQKKLVILKELNAFNKMDSAKEWINSHLDSIFTGYTDTNDQIDYHNIQLSHINEKQKRVQYSLDCLEFKISYLDSHSRILRLKQFDSVQKIRDSVSQNLINYHQGEISTAETSSNILRYLLKLIYLPIILLFPGRWLLNYIRNRN